MTDTDLDKITYGNIHAKKMTFEEDLKDYRDNIKESILKEYKQKVKDAILSSRHTLQILEKLGLDEK